MIAEYYHSVDPSPDAAGAASKWPGPADAAYAAGAYYHFQQFVLKLPFKENQLFVQPQGSQTLSLIDTPGTPYSVLAHELTHYAQAMSTVLGQSILLNWFSLLHVVASELRNQDPILVPVASSNCQSSRNVLRAWNAYMHEVATLVGASLDVRPQSDFSGTGAWEFFEYNFRHPADNGAASGIGLVVPGESGLVGVPLQGDVFLEGQAQAVQWLVDGESTSVSERLKSRPVDPQPGKKKDIYYTAVARLVAEKLTGWEPFHTTALLCDVALCARSPAEAFVDAFKQLKALPPIAPADFGRLRQHFAGTPYSKSGRDFIDQQIVLRRQESGNSSSSSLAGLIESLCRLMDRAWCYRTASPYHFLDDQYREQWVHRVVAAVGAPPMFLEGKISVVTLTDDKELTRACFWARGSFDLVNGLVRGGLKDECALLRTKICTHAKAKQCSSGNLLFAPTSNGMGCHVAKAAQGLGLYQRRWNRQP